MSAPGDLEARFGDLSIAPTGRAERDWWFAEISDWRASARAAVESDRERYGQRESSWARSAFVCGLVMLWEERFYDPNEDLFLVDEFLDDAERQFGGYDALILWHAYPRIGFDERNQFDFYREIPGGLDGLAGIVERLHARGVRAILDYNPWDTSTRPEGVPDSVALAQLFEKTGADGLFLDTMSNASLELLQALDSVAPGIVLQSEHVVPLERITDHLISWVQWPENLDRRVVLRNKWFEPRQMQNIVRRWHTSHSDELHTAWLNGTGLVLWENVFGSWYPWSESDLALLAMMRPMQRQAARFFADGEWEPFVSTSTPDIAASRWDLDGATLWTLSNRSTAPVLESECFAAQGSGRSLVDMLTLEPLDPLDPVISVEPGAVGCVLSFDSSWGPFVESMLAVESADVTAPPGAPALRRTELPNLAPRDLPDAMVLLTPGPRSVESVFRMRECGSYGRAELVDSTDPDFSQSVVDRREIVIEAVAVATQPITNAEFAQFLADSHYRPRDSRAFLRHWIDGVPAADDLHNPVTFVDLDDARAYATWAGMRLPTEYEWQVSMTEAGNGYGRRRVWEWTESEHSDGHTRFVMLKGGSDLPTGDSSWYAESGPLRAEQTAKFLLFYPGLDRCSTIGFRCAVPIDENSLARI